ncbi:lmo1851 family serine protease [Bacillus testis]|uniref:lmo1851 family serine protease n=1 Tax=Bacillus testis TaxID=1622072 RepID=UPI000A5027AF|nr:S41 family peptidase [Bacillus testis]
MFRKHDGESGEKMDNENKRPDEGQSNKYIKFKKFHFIMGVFFIIFVTAAVTTIALTFGDKKVQPTVTSNDRSEFNKLYATYDTIKNEYYTDVKDQTLVNGAINGMMEALDDPYSDYMNEKEASSFNEQISASFEGIGAEIQEQNGQISIVSPIKGSPAEKAGLKAHDIIVSVDGKALQGVSSSEAVSKIRGKKGSKVTLMIKRGNSDPFKVTLTRDTIPIETVYSEMLKDDIAHIQVTSFSENTSTELAKGMKEMKEKGMKGLVLDLRGNPGGIMQEAVKIASMFVPNNKVVLQVEDRAGNKQAFKSDNKGENNFPVVVLVDSGSASASEIVAAAMSESAGIKLVGEKTFGKGTVQTAKEFKDKSNIKFTTAKWLTPDGNWIHKKGIQPDVKVELPSYAHLTVISPDQEMKVGSSSTETKTAEQMLEALGYNTGAVDGIFDEQTKAAVIQLQKDANLKQDGILKGDTTVALMNKLREKIVSNDTQLNKAVEILSQTLKK